MKYETPRRKIIGFSKKIELVDEKEQNIMELSSSKVDDNGDTNSHVDIISIVGQDDKIPDDEKLVTDHNELTIPDVTSNFKYEK